MRRALRALTCSIAGLTLTGCVTETVALGAGSVPTAGFSSNPIVVPLRPAQAAGGEQEAARDQFYSSILGQMNEAVVDRDASRLGQLLAQHDEPRAPSWAKKKFDRFRELLGALAFYSHAAETGDVRPAVADAVQLEGGPWRVDRLGEAVPVRFRLDAGSHGAVRMLGRGRTAFRFTFTLTDHDVAGGRTDRVLQEIVRLDRSLRLGTADDGLVLETVIPAARLRGVRRDVRVEVELLPGLLEIDGERVPAQRVRCATARVELYPQGTAAVRAQPLRTLRAAIRRGGDEGVFPHVALATFYMPAVDREAAVDELIGWLRVSNRDQVRVATAALRAVTGVGLPLDERERWLAWYARERGGE